uniref:Uncharacterized protein n=1 Tax=Sphaerodactylus townsendi TaxID=933632 RepID=A0ACB8FIR6_9SAUR
MCSLTQQLLGALLDARALLLKSRLLVPAGQCDVSQGKGSLRGPRAGQVKSMRNVPNLFISSLAIGDLLLLLTCVPVDASRYLSPEWLFGRVGCKLIPFIQLTSVGVSVFTLMALSADRNERNSCIHLSFLNLFPPNLPDERFQVAT